MYGSVCVCACVHVSVWVGENNMARKLMAADPEEDGREELANVR